MSEVSTSRPRKRHSKVNSQHLEELILRGVSDKAIASITDLSKVTIAEYRRSLGFTYPKGWPHMEKKKSSLYNSIDPKWGLAMPWLYPESLSESGQVVV